jgi:hypothetical protein
MKAKNFLAAGLLLSGLSSLSHGAVTTFFSSGSTCSSPISSTTFTPGSPGTPLTVSLCVSTTVEKVCGATIQLQSASAAEDVRFKILNRTLGPSMTDPNTLSPGFPISITNPRQSTDLGATVTTGTPPAAGTNQLLATFQLEPQSTAVNNSYTISLSSLSSIATETTNCFGSPVDTPISASLNLTKFSAIATRTDFNADGKPDITWKNSATGETYVWYMDGATNLGAGYITTLPPEWTLAGTPDLNNDGKPDILWRNTSSGEIYVWYMNGTTITGASFLFSVAPVWRIAATADMNGDGKPDILWQNSSTGEVYIWYLDGPTLTGAGYVTTLPTEWRLSAANDLNADGKSDILWHNQSTGEVWAWYMNNTTINAASFLFYVPAPWRIAGLADMNADGKPDVLWRNTSTGEVYAWYLNGATLTGAAFLFVVPTAWDALM